MTQIRQINTNLLTDYNSLICVFYASFAFRFFFSKANKNTNYLFLLRFTDDKFM